MCGFTLYHLWTLGASPALMRFTKNRIYLVKSIMREMATLLSSNRPGLYFSFLSEKNTCTSDDYNVVDL